MLFKKKPVIQTTGASQNEINQLPAQVRSLLRVLTSKAGDLVFCFVNINGRTIIPPRPTNGKTLAQTWTDSTEAQIINMSLNN